MVLSGIGHVLPPHVDRVAYRSTCAANRPVRAGPWSNVPARSRPRRAPAWSRTRTFQKHCGQRRQRPARVDHVDRFTRGHVARVPKFAFVLGQPLAAAADEDAGSRLTQPTGRGVLGRQPPTQPRLSDVDPQGVFQVFAAEIGHVDRGGRFRPRDGRPPGSRSLRPPGLSQGQRPPPMPATNRPKSGP